MKQMAGKGIRDRMRMVRQIQQTALTNPGGRLARQKKGTGKRLTSRERARLKKDRERELRRKKRHQRQDPTLGAAQE
jgi:signal recognition particle subunit SRP54